MDAKIPIMAITTKISINVNPAPEEALRNGLTGLANKLYFFGDGTSPFLIFNILYYLLYYDLSLFILIRIFAITLRIPVPNYKSVSALKQTIILQTRPLPPLKSAESIPLSCQRYHSLLGYKNPLFSQTFLQFCRCSLQRLPFGLPKLENKQNFEPKIAII